MKGSLILTVFVIISGFTGQIEPSKKYNLIVFEGSDWCPNCIRLEKNILNDTAFIQFLNRWNIVLIKIDFPQQKKLTGEQKLYNGEVAGKYKFEGIFPTIIISRSDTLDYKTIYYRNQSVEEIKALIQHNLQILQ